VKSRLIDIHPHVISTDTVRYPRAPIGGHQSDWSRDRPVSHEQMVQDQIAAGVDKAALVQGSTCYGHDNTYVAEAVAAHPERFAGVFSCELTADDAVATMKHWMAKGLTGMRLFTTGSTMPGQQNWLDDPKTFPGWGLAEEAGLPVCLQMTADGIPALENVLHRFPRLRVVLDHLARPKQEDGPPYAGAESLWRLSRYPGVYPKITERNLEGAVKGKATPESFFGKLVSEFGASRLAWGSNYPASEKPLKALVKLGQDTLAFLPERDREWIFARTAQTLYPRLAD
jgi:L-fuconolactonase